ncbi:MAG: Zinc-binding protein of the histidine triad (HIT) family [uncultured Solirubrobacteraceae bacterium]|uniref:Zinc-binding protein of the histidine triad (HIT) family n=1 Tax=uncultured Solirubrobacteraceae bacterium TaxID=1162706 RepID=A0A6J4RKK3_9ACTN|nr:MAG: Zinc-binding protein of the histidine triad (HIT) family [uncultured Solirubrobacteraceae bacterium]
MSAPGSGGCLFCRIAAGDAPAAVVHSDEQTVAFLDVRPVFEGHTLVVPRVHVETLPELPSDLLVPVMGVVQRVCDALETALGAHGTFVAMNNRVSQSVPHLHVHVVPRRRKDGLRGFFWPRRRYEDGEMDAVAERIRAVLASDHAA